MPKRLLLAIQVQVFFSQYEIAYSVAGVYVSGLFEGERIVEQLETRTKYLITLLMLYYPSSRASATYSGRPATTPVDK